MCIQQCCTIIKSLIYWRSNYKSVFWLIWQHRLWRNTYYSNQHVCSIPHYKISQIYMFSYQSYSQSFSLDDDDIHVMKSRNTQNWLLHFVTLINIHYHLINRNAAVQSHHSKVFVLYSTTASSLLYKKSFFIFMQGNRKVPFASRCELSI